MIDDNIYGVIYKIRNKINNKIYIGQTSQYGGFDRRYKNNILEYTHNEHLKASISKYGIENFEIDKEFDIAFSIEELNKLETMYIKIYKTYNPKYGYNKTLGGNVTKLSDETKNKISESLKVAYSNGNMVSWNKGKKCPQLGRKKTEEQRKQLSEMKKEFFQNNKRYAISDDSRKKLSQSSKKSWTEERKSKASETTKKQHQNIEFKTMISDNLKRRWDNEEERERLCNSMKKSYLIVDTYNNSYIEFLGRKALAEYIQMSEAYVKKYLSKGLLHKNRYLLVRKDNYFEKVA